MKTIIIFGSTGTIGQNTLEVIKQNKNYKVIALCAGKNIDLLNKQIDEFKPLYVSVELESDYKILKNKYKNITVFFGQEGLINIANIKCDIVISAIVGFAGFIPTYHAIKNGTKVALANKESLIAGGELLKTVMKNKEQIIPVDSEHSAIFQCLKGNSVKDIKKIILTASGGPFLNTNISELKNITVKDALKHPNWKMGAKITIDSSTMMNKTFEVIEAGYLFDLKSNKIDVVIHPQSIIHSMVLFKDGSIISQMSNPDMKLPISYALSHPNHTKLKIKNLSFNNLNLTFLTPDIAKFPSLKFADFVLKNKKYGVILNASNEVAVNSFLEGKIKWTDIYNVVEEIILLFQNINFNTVKNLEELTQIDKLTRIYTNELIIKKIKEKL